MRERNRLVTAANDSVNRTQVQFCVEHLLDSVTTVEQVRAGIIVEFHVFLFQQCRDVRVDLYEMHAGQCARIFRKARSGCHQRGESLERSAL